MRWTIGALGACWPSMPARPATRSQRTRSRARRCSTPTNIAMSSRPASRRLPRSIPAGLGRCAASSCCRGIPCPSRIGIPPISPQWLPLYLRKRWSLRRHARIPRHERPDKTVVLFGSIQTCRRDDLVRLVKIVPASPPLPKPVWKRVRAGAPAYHPALLRSRSLPLT